MHEGEVLDGRYALLRRLATTATSEVWQAYDQDASRPVALKFLPMNADDSLRKSLVERFKREADVFNRLKHPAIPDIYEIRNHGQGVDPSSYLVRELVQGSTLARVLSHRRPTMLQALNVALQVTEALQVVHSRGIVHRDLKPSNLMINESGKVHLLDFGVAYVMGAEPSSQEQLAGTPPYMAPEQIAADELDGRADIYALGCILYEMLAGNPAVSSDGTLSETLLRQVRESPTPLIHRSSEIPPEIDQLVLKLLAKSPDDRPGVVETLATLRAYLPVNGDEGTLSLAPSGAEDEEGVREYFGGTVPPDWDIRLRDSTTDDSIGTIDPTASYRILPAVREISVVAESVLKEIGSPASVPTVTSSGSALLGDEIHVGEDVGPAAEALEGALARLFVRLGPPPELVDKETAPVGSDGGGVAE
ncbi:serine/threonine-protein kinase [Streptomyces niveus]|uniref:serine/threonine-protein kinase n=1 Tax=Streptomyces niveus TaxID=193462 RepID=UPI00342E6818